MLKTLLFSTLLVGVSAYFPAKPYDVESSVEGCCSGWLRNSQTSKNLYFSQRDSNAVVTNRIPLFQPSSAETVAQLQIHADFVLYAEAMVQSETCRCACSDCRYYVDAALVLKPSGQTQTIPVSNLPPPTPPDYFTGSITSIANSTNILYAMTGSLMCYDQKLTLDWNSISDPDFQSVFPSGIQFNDGESVELIWAARPSDENICSVDLPAVETQGWINYVLAYA